MRATEVAREFAAAIDRTAQAVVDEVAAVARQHAQVLAGRVRSAYPQGKTGNLRRGVTWGPNRPGARIGAWVRSNAPHVHFLEAGTAMRRNKAGANRGRVQGPGPGRYQISVPLAVAQRREFYGDVTRIVERRRRVE